VRNLGQSRWDAADLKARLCRALDIAKRAVDFFAREGYADAEVPENSFGPEKPIAETAMLVYAVSTARHLPDVAQRIEEIAQLLLPHARSPRTLLNAALHPSMALDFAVPHVLLTKLGYCDPDFDIILKSCLSWQTQYGHERPPFASVEQKWITSLWMGVQPGRGWRSDLLNSVMHRPLDILGGPRQNAYGFTHLIMYCTDFGHGAGRFPRRRSAILDEASSLLAKCLDEEDYDLAGELLMAWPLMGARWCASATFAFRVLARVEDQVGLLPGGTTKASRVNKLEGKERTQYALGTAYHTALVMGLLCAAALRPGRAPFVRITGPKYERSLLEHLLRCIDRDQGHWQPELSELSDSERNALAPFLLDIAISQKCRKHEYEAVRQLLATASQHGLANTTLCGQSALLLERLAVCSQAVEMN
jgi:hypothetical protein